MISMIPVITICSITSLFALQLFVTDRVDIGLLNVTDATVRRRLNATITQLADVIEQGLTGTVDNFRFGVTSLRQCTSGEGINDGCSTGKVVATGKPDLSDSGSRINIFGTRDRIEYWLLAIMAVYIINFIN